MSKSTIDTTEQVTIKKRKSFKEHHHFVRMSFIFSNITSLYAIIFGVFVSVTQKPGIIALYTIIAIIGTIAFIGLILNSISFGKGRNIFNILGFIFSLIVSIWYFMSIVLIATSGL